MRPSAGEIIGVRQRGITLSLRLHLQLVLVIWMTKLTPLLRCLKQSYTQLIVQLAASSSTSFHDQNDQETFMAHGADDIMVNFDSRAPEVESLGTRTKTTILQQT